MNGVGRGDGGKGKCFTIQPRLALQSSLSFHVLGWDDLTKRHRDVLRRLNEENTL